MSFGKDHFTFFQRIIFKMSRRWMDDKCYAEWMMRRRFGGGDIDSPETFNEKIQWLKLYDRNPLYSQLADKYLVRDYVTSKIGEEYLNPLFAVYDNHREIDFSSLPNAFVLKANHGSGEILIVKDKTTIDERKVRAICRKWLLKNYYHAGREWVYKNIIPKIVCEHLLTDDDNQIPFDYKVFCFNGEPCFIQVDVDRFENHTRIFFDSQWQEQDFELAYKRPDKHIDRPYHLEEMMNLSRKLAVNIPFVRIDFYALPKLVFGEMTFYPGNGFEHFYPPEWDLKMGKFLQLSCVKML